MGFGVVVGLDVPPLRWREEAGQAECGYYPSIGVGRVAGWNHRRQTLQTV